MLQPTKESAPAVEGQHLYIKHWLAKIEAIDRKNYPRRRAVFEEALRTIPTSYKLWKMFFDETLAFLSKQSPISIRIRQTSQKFEECLQFMCKMPRIWLLFAQHLKNSGQVFILLETLNRALESLPATQHDKIWPFYLQFAEQSSLDETSIAIMRRFVKYKPSYQENLAEFLEQRGRFGEAAEALFSIAKSETFYSEKGTTQFEFYSRLCRIMAEHPSQMSGIDCDKIFRTCLGKYSDEIGKFWVSYAEFFIRQGNFGRARSVFEEALASIATARDFGLTFNAYVKFEEELLTFLFENDTDDLQEASESAFKLPSKNEQLQRIEQLIEKRDLYLNSCQLKQNPHSVAHWLKRFALLEDSPAAVDACFLEALRTIDAGKIDGSISSVWNYIGAYFGRKKGPRTMNLLFQKALSQNFKSQPEYPKILAFWLEQLLALGFYADALKVLRQLLTENLSVNNAGLFSRAKSAVSNSNAIWSLYLDLEYNFGNEKALEKAYNLMLEKRIASPLNAFNFLKLLEEKGEFAAMFKICETALEIFQWPANYHFWLFYLENFERHFGEKKMERMRDLYEKAISEVPKEKCGLISLDFLSEVCHL